MVSVVVPFALTGELVRLQVEPVGRPGQLVALNATVSLKPWTGTMVRTVVPVPPAVLTVTAAGLEEIMKSAAPPLPTFHSLTRLATFSEPRPVARLNPGPAL